MGSMIQYFHSLTKEDFVNPGVLTAIHPHPLLGYAHGPIPRDPDSTSATDGQQDPAKEPAYLAINKVHSLVCDILVTGNTMCRFASTTRSRMILHYRTKHRRAVYSRVGSKSTDVRDAIIGANAIKRWVLTGGWRDALYNREPMSRGTDGLVVLHPLCDALENIARNDAEFAAEYGTQFHRPSQEPVPLSIRSNRRADNAPQPTSSRRPTKLEILEGFRPESASRTEPDSPNLAQDHVIDLSEDEYSDGARIEIIDLVSDESEGSDCSWPSEAASDLWNVKVKSE